MARLPDGGEKLPWRADCPAIAFYDTLAGDERLDATVREDAKHGPPMPSAISVPAHRESGDFEPFGGEDYDNAAGPTVHLPTDRKQIDPWARAGVSETDNEFYKNVDEDEMTRVLTFPARGSPLRRTIARRRNPRCV